MDVRMPAGGGVASASRIAELEDRPMVVLCSRLDRPDIRGEARAYSADAYYCKERFSGELLRQILAQHGAWRWSATGGLA